MADKKQPKPLGEPLPLTDADLDELSQVSRSDIKAAVVLWDEESGMPGLLDSKPDEGNDNNSR